MKRILTVAASDSGGGAGIQADVKTIALMGGFPMTVITALTAQNREGISGIYRIPLRFVSSQLDAVLSDTPVDAVKTGVLFAGRVIELLARKLRFHKKTRVIVDPVMVSGSGFPLLAANASAALKKSLMPLAFVVTPNLHEASALTGRTVGNKAQMREAARNLYQTGADNVLITGGHLRGTPTDILYDGMDFYEFEAERVRSGKTHGTGCTFSAALATQIADGIPLPEAIECAKDFVTTGIRFSPERGEGCRPLNLYASFIRHQEIRNCSSELKRALEVLAGAPVGRLIPEVQSNLGYALPNATRFDDVVSFPGRIVRYKRGIATVGDPEPGASRHVAEIILAVVRHQPQLRSAMNIRYAPEIIRKCRRLKLKVAAFDRAEEPHRVKSREGASLNWGIETLISGKKDIPDIIYDLGDRGKEPMVRVIGKNPMDVAEKVLQIAE